MPRHDDSMDAEQEAAVLSTESRVSFLQHKESW